MNVFISYRRDDSAIAARLVHAELSQRLDPKSLFMDLDDIGYGDDFAAVIDAHLARADVVIVVVGPRWHGIIEQRLRGDDWVRHEVQQSLALAAAAAARRPRGAPAGRAARPQLLVVQLDDTDWPGAALPAALAPLQRLSALKLRRASLKTDLAELVQAVHGLSFEDEAAAARTETRIRRWARALGSGAAVVLFAAAWTGMLESLNLDTYVAGWTVQWSAAAAAAAQPGGAPVALVAIDRAAVQALGRELGPSWRREHARIVERAAAAGARALAFDLFMPTAGPADADDALAGALRAVQGRLPVFVAVADAAADGSGGPALAPALAPLAGWGVACAGKRVGQVALQLLAVQRPAGAASAPPQRWPSLALAAFSRGGIVRAVDPVALTVQTQLRGDPQRDAATIAFHTHETLARPQDGCPFLRPGDATAGQWIDPGPWLPGTGQRAFVRVGYRDVLAGRPEAVQALAGRTVLVGPLLPGIDEFGLVGAADRTVWGSEIVAAHIAALHAGHAIRPLGALAQAAWLTALALAGAALARRLHGRPRAWRAGAWMLAAAAVVGGALAWFALERQLVAWHHGLLALAAGGTVAAVLRRRFGRTVAWSR